MLTSSDPDKLNSTSCNSSLTIQMEASEQSFHKVLFVLQHFARNLEFSSKNFTLATLGVKARINSVSGMF